MNSYSCKYDIFTTDAKAMFKFVKMGFELK